MKRILCIILTAALLLTVGAAGFADIPIPGDYKLFIIDVEGMQTDPKTLGLDLSFTLREDGSGAMFTNGTEDLSFTWTFENGKLSLNDADGYVMEAELQDGVACIEMMPGYYMYFAATSVDTANFKMPDRTPDSLLYGIYKRIDAEQGAHLRYDYHSDYMDSLSSFEVHAKDGVYYSLRTTRANGYEGKTLNFFRDGKSYVLYPDKMSGTLAATTASNIISNNVLMLDDLYNEIGNRALRSDFTKETRELDGVIYRVEVYPAASYYADAVFYYNDDGTLVHILVGPPALSPQLGETFYTVYAIDDQLDETLFDISGYTIAE